MLGVGQAIPDVAVRAQASSTIAFTSNTIAANRLLINDTTATYAAPRTMRRVMSASPQGDITDLKFTWLNWYMTTTGSQSASGNSINLRAFVEYPAGSFTPILFNSLADFNIPSGGQATSDAVGIVIPAGATFAVRTVLTSGASVVMPVATLPERPQLIGTEDAQTSGDFGNSGIVPTTASGAQASTWGPSACVGTVRAANARAFMILGDSIAVGTGDISSSGAKGGSGYIARGLDPLYPYVRIARGDLAAYEYLAASRTRITAFLAVLGYTDFISNLAVNDISDGRTQAQVMADLTAIHSLNIATAATRRYQTTATPSTTSTDSWATTGNQSNRGTGNWANAAAINDAIRTGIAGVTGIIEAADSAMSFRNSQLWAAPPTATADGIHPNSTMATTLASTVAPVIG